MPLHAARRWTSYTEPWEPLFHAAWALRVTIGEVLRARGVYATIWGASEWRDKAFALWYKSLNANFLRFEARTAVPSLVGKASGVVVDLGPALGNQIPSFSPAATHVFGIEPNPFFMADLEDKVKESGMSGKYTVVACGVEEDDVLRSYGVKEGGVDTVLCIQVLCSVGDPEDVARRMYALLKPGGKLIFWEHHRNHDLLTSIVQWLWNPLWRFGVGDCSMTRDPVGILKRAGKWEGFESIQGDEQPWSLLPRVWGELVKI